jgi:hypothetical protein
MKFFRLLTGLAWTLVFSGGACFGEVKVVVERIDNDNATPAFAFKNIPPPFGASAVAGATITILSGAPNLNGGEKLDKLRDGAAPTEPDQPEENFFFANGSAGGRILIDLGRSIAIKQVNTYSWHPNTRGPQVYELYAGDAGRAGFDSKPTEAGAELVKLGWRLVAKVDTRPKAGPMGGQYGVSISDSDGVVGTNRHLLLDVSATEDTDPFGNTFYSEIAVIDRDAPPVVAVAPRPDAMRSFEMEGPKYRFSIDTARAPGLKDWANETLAPVVREWYPKIVQLLPSDGFVAPLQFSIVLTTNYHHPGIAITRGTRVTCDANWCAGELNGEAVGSIVHELVHVAQQYESAGFFNPNATRPPGWLVEGIPDYLRFYLFEPGARGADIASRHGGENARYDASYRVTANFLSFVVEKYDKRIIQELNAALREGKYSPVLWKELTGRAVEDLGAEWKAGLLGRTVGASADKVFPSGNPASP